MTLDHSRPEDGSLAVLFGVCLAALILPLSFSGGAVATPAIGHDLGGSPTGLTWITNAFMLSFGSLLMAAGALSDQFGRKRIFAIGVAIFAMVSLALMMAPNVWSIDLLRAAQGVGAAGALSGGTAALAQEFHGRARTKAFSLLGTTFGIGLAFGPILAGFLIDALGWRSIFMTTAIVGGLSLLLGVPKMRETRDPNAAGLDWPGVLTFTAALSLFTFGVIQAPESGWSNPYVIALFVNAAIFLGVFALVETRSSRPMLDLSLFRYPRFVGVQFLPIATCYAYIVLLVLLPLRFIGIDGLSEVEAGVLMIAISAPMLLVPSLAAYLTRWSSPGLISALGLIVSAFGLLWLGQVADGPAVASVPAMLLIGIGAGFPWGLMDGLSVSVVPVERAGMASGIFSTTRVAGEGVALAITSAILAGLSSMGVAALSGTGSGIGQETFRAVGQRLATGDIGGAAALVPQIDRAALAQSYAASFEMLTYVLASITIASAIVIFWSIGREKSGTQAVGAIAGPAPAE